MVTTAVNPKHMLVNGEKIKWKLPQNIAWGAVAALVGGFIISALYYLITQVKYHVVIDHTTLINFYLKPHWDHALSQSWWPFARHDLRDVYEGVLATLLAKSLITKKKYWNKKPVGWFRIITAPFLVALAAAPVVALGIWIVDVHNFSVPGALVTWQAYAIGIVAAQFAHRAWAPIGNTVQLFFVHQALAGGHRPKWPLPPIVRERYQYELDKGVKPTDYGRWFTVSVATMSTVFFALAVYGGYIRLWVAHHS